MSILLRLSRWRRCFRAVALPLAALSLVTCAEDPVGVGDAAARLKLTPILPPYARVAPLVIDRVGIIVERLIPETESSERVYSDTVAFPVDRDRLTLDDVSITMDAASEDLLVTLQLLSGTTLLFQGSQTVTVVRGQRTSNTQIPVFYQGPGSNVASLLLAPRDTVVRPGASVDFRLDAFDVAGAPVPQYYAGWSLTGGAASSARINAVGRLTASSVNDTFYVKVAAPNGVLDSTLVMVASSTTPPATTLTWTGAVSTDWSVAGNWSPAQVPGFLDSVVIGASAAQRQPSLSEPVVTGSLSIVTGGNLTIAGQGISIVRGLTTGATGVLTMTDPADVVVVQGDAVFDGGNELDLMSAGGLSIGGNLTQRATNSGDSFHPSGTHVTLLAGATPTVSFASPGVVPGSSHFQDVAWIGTGTLTLATPVFAHGTLIVESQSGSIIASGNASRLTVGDFATIGQVALNNVPLTLSQTTTDVLSLSNVTFQNMPTTAAQLTVSHPGGSFTFRNLVFSTTPVAPNGFYLDVTDNTGPTDGGLVIDMENPTPATPGVFLATSGGAVVNWPTGAVAVRIWSGASSSNWGSAGNWVGGVAPGAADSAVIVTAPNAPVLGSNATVGAVNVTSGMLTLGGNTFGVARTFATTGTGTLTMTNPLDALVIQGDALFAGGSTDGLLTNGTIAVGGSFTQQGGTSPLSFAATSPHTVRFDGTSAFVTFATPGLAASRFGNLRQGSANNGFSPGSDIAVSGDLLGPTSTLSTIFTANNFALTVTRAFNCCVTLDGMRLVLDDLTGQTTALNGITFVTLANTLTQLTVRHPGGATPLTLTGIGWQTLAAGNTGSYIDATDVNGATGGTLTVDVISNDPGNGPTFTRVSGGATVIWPTGTVVRVWSGAVSTDWSAPGNWTGGVVPGPADSVVIPATANQPVLSTAASAGGVNVTGGTLSIGGQILTVARGFATTGTGTLTMTSPGVLRIFGSATFGGGSTNGLITEGNIEVGGDFTQTGATSPQSFAASGNNTVLLTNLRATVTFGSPGLTASHFAILEEGGSSSGFSFNSDVAVSVDLLGPDGLTGSISGSNVSLTTTNGVSCCVTLDGVRLIVDDPTGLSSSVNGVAFLNLPTSAAQLTLRTPGGAVPTLVTGITWMQLQTGNAGSYIDATDTNGPTGGGLIVNAESQDPGNGPTFTKVGGGAQVFWPGTPVQWTGAISTDWFIPGNWNNLRVPFQNITSIPAGTPNAPVVTGLTANVSDLTVAPAATLTIQTSGSLTASGNVNAAGSIVTTGTATISLTGTGGGLSGNVGNIVVSGSRTLSGDVVVAAGATVQVQGTLALGGRRLRADDVTVGTTSGLLVMTNPNDSLIVSNGMVFQGADETGQLTAGVIAVQGGMTVAGISPNQFFASGTHKVVLNGARTEAIGFTANTGSQFQNLEIAITGGFGAVLNATTVTVAGDLSVTSGQLTPSGRRLNVGGNLSITGTSLLNMTNPGDSLFVAGSATFAGASTVSRLTDGVLKVVGGFTQSAVNSVTSFSPSGLHKTVLGGALVSDVSMGSPGLGAAGSHFQVLDASPATGGIILDVNMQADSLISTAAAATISGPLVALTARRVQVSGLTFQNTRFILDEQGVAVPENFSNVTFNGYPGTSTDLTLFTVIGPGGAAAARPAVTTNNVNFLTLPVGANNFYVDLTSSNGFAFVMTMTGSNQGRAAGGNGETLWQGTPPTGVAVVSWP